MSLTARSGAAARQAPTTPLPLIVAGAVAGAAAAAFSYLVLVVVALAAWMLDPSGSQEWSQMLEVASGAWLAGLGLAPTLGGVTITLLPLGFGLLALAALIAASRWAADASAVGRAGEAVAVSLAVSLAFAGVTAVISALSGSLSITPPRAALTAGLIALVVSFAVVAQRADVLRLARAGQPDSGGSAAAPGQDARDVAAAVGVALLGIVIAASVLLAAAVIANFAEMTAVLVQLDAGLSGLLLLAVLTLGYLPIAIVWSAAYLLGPGVTVAVGTQVGPYAETSTAALPGFPLLAALPGTPPGGAVLLPLAGVAAGALAGFLLRRRGRVGARGALLAAACALATGLVTATAAWLASGSLGDTSLRDLGPSPLATGIAAFLVIGVGAAAVSAWPARHADG